GDFWGLNQKTKISLIPPRLPVPDNALENGAASSSSRRYGQSKTALTRQNLLLRRRSVTVSKVFGLPASLRRALVRLCSVTNQKVLMPLSCCDLIQMVKLAPLETNARILLPV